MLQPFASPEAGSAFLCRHGAVPCTVPRRLTPSVGATVAAALGGGRNP